MSQTDFTPVSNSITYTWDITLYEQEGRVFMNWSTTAPFRPQQCKAVMFNKPCPPNMAGIIAETWAYQNGPWDTGLTWGTGYYGALVAEVGGDRDNDYRYVITVGPTKA